MIKKIQIELVILGFLILTILASSNFDIDFYEKFNNLNLNFEQDYFKNFFIKITELGNSFWYFLISIIMYVLCLLLKKRGDGQIFLYKIIFVINFLII